LTLNASPWAQVFVDGERKKDTPLRGLPLSEGHHEVRLFCPSRNEERSFSIDIEPGKTVRKLVEF
jgi:hypothetical protein